MLGAVLAAGRQVRAGVKVKHIVFGHAKTAIEAVGRTRLQWPRPTCIPSLLRDSRLHAGKARTRVALRAQVRDWGDLQMITASPPASHSPGGQFSVAPEPRSWRRAPP
jgi:hypothetical protein